MNYLQEPNCILIHLFFVLAMMGHSFMQTRPPIIWMGRNCCGWVELWVDGEEEQKEQKRSSKTIDIVSYALEASVNGVTCVFVVHFRSSHTS